MGLNFAIKFFRLGGSGEKFGGWSAKNVVVVDHPPLHRHQVGKLYPNRKPHLSLIFLLSYFLILPNK